MPNTIEKCAECGLRTDFCKKGVIKKYRRRISEKPEKFLIARKFTILLQSIDGDWPHSISKSDSLFMFLSRLRFGLSIAKILHLFQLKKNTIYVGLTHLSRGEIQIKYTSELSQKLLQVNEENIITVWDATYVYIEKSSNYSFQKKSFSSHKGRNLVKIMLLCDIYVVDRGFRDCMEFLKELGMDVFMPLFLNVGKQHITKESNESRIITKNRKKKENAKFAKF
ncbi:Vacuolar sorting-associated 13C [Brachionus plicatilis]|uniref:Vacuolar sorting-associated 13C n=1 Tax=Brachionus plicatilis TaxID=10195 RepID=A0A3M7PUM1_BRAPC|nr:Vacuolar sorting-associated 13C [Brachionus plicatilis]